MVKASKAKDVIIVVGVVNVTIANVIAENSINLPFLDLVLVRVSAK